MWTGNLLMVEYSPERAGCEGTNATGNFVDCSRSKALTSL